MANDDSVMRLRQGAAAWNEWRQAHGDVVLDLSSAHLRGLDLSQTDLSRADLRSADLRGTIFRGALLIRARLDGANLFKAVLDGADLSDAVLDGVLFLNCAQLMVAKNWETARRDPSLGCGAPIPGG